MALKSFIHRGIICRKAYLEVRVTPQIALETFHSPEAVDNYVLDFARVYFATVQRGMSVDEVAFAIQRPRNLVEEYVKLIAEFGLANEQVYQRAGIQMTLRDEHVEPMVTDALPLNESML